MVQVSLNPVISLLVSRELTDMDDSTFTGKGEYQLLVSDASGVELVDPQQWYLVVQTLLLLMVMVPQLHMH